MIKIENVQTFGWDEAIRGMRNPMNSWRKSDSCYEIQEEITEGAHEVHDIQFELLNYKVGPNDFDLMKRLAKAGPEHAKYRRMITVYADITAPLYWYKEMDTYKVGTVCNSCSTMHTIHEKEFKHDMFSCEHMVDHSFRKLLETITELNFWRDIYLNGGTADNADASRQIFKPRDKEAWYQMIQLLPSSYNQRRTYMFNYEVLSNIYRQRRNHKLNEWVDFCKWIEILPYSEVITLK